MKHGSSVWQVGDLVEAGQKLMVLEAMKVRLLQSKQFINVSAAWSTVYFECGYVMALMLHRLCLLKLRSGTHAEA